MSIVYELTALPVHSCLLMPTKQEALAYPKGDLVLAFCEACGFLSNLVFDPAVHEYSGRYEETQGFSPTFNAFARELAARWVDRYDLRGKDIIEIGCGKGEFLILLCELGENRGVGFDPSYVPERTASPAAGRVRFIRDFYSERYADVQGDFICCRHTLEHIRPTREFLSIVRRSIGDRGNTVVCFELPDVLRVLRELAFWDIYYEHCSYFSLGSLARLFRSSGFDILDLATAYGGQYLLIEARPDGNGGAARLPVEDDLDDLASAVRFFRENIAAKIDAWNRDLLRWREEGKRVAVWGSGSKGVAFLTTLEAGQTVAYAVDINPYRHGYFMPGTGHRIVGPKELPDQPPDVVVVMNPIYCGEIRADLGRLGLDPELVPV